MSDPKAALVPFHNPQSLEQGLALARSLASAGLVPDALKGKPNDILLIIMKGNELGLLPMQSLGSIDVIQGKPVMKAELMAALVRSKREVCQYLKLAESSDVQAVFETHRVGDPSPTKLAYTMGDAEKAGLTGKKNWKEQPKTMLRWRAMSAICRLVYPDLIQGVYTPEEIEELDVTPDRSAPPAQGAPSPGAAIEDAQVVEPSVTAAQIESEVEQIMHAMEIAKSKADLISLVPRIKELPEERRAEIRAQYEARQKEITNGHPS